MDTNRYEVLDMDDNWDIGRLLDKLYWSRIVFFKSE